MRIKGNLFWRTDQGELSKIESISEYADLDNCISDLPNLRTIGGYAYLEYCKSDLPNLRTIGGYAYLHCCKADLPNLRSIGRSAYLVYCESDLSNLRNNRQICQFINIVNLDLSNLRTIDGWADLKKYDKKLPKLESINGREFKPNQIVLL